MMISPSEPPSDPREGDLVDNPMVITLPLLFWGLSPPSSTDLPEGKGMPPASPGSGIAAVALALELGSTTLDLMLFRLRYLKLMPRAVYSRFELQSVWG